MLTNDLIIRRSQIKRDMVLSCNSEKVYRVFLFGKEILNSLNYDEVSNYFDWMEEE